MSLRGFATHTHKKALFRTLSFKDSTKDKAKMASFIRHCHTKTILTNTKREEILSQSIISYRFRAISSRIRKREVKMNCLATKTQSSMPKIGT